MASENASRSSGFREVIRFPSSTTSRSIQRAPAFRRSFRTDGHDVSVRPDTASASMSSCGPWHTAATSFPLAQKAQTKATTSRSRRR